MVGGPSRDSSWEAFLPLGFMVSWFLFFKDSSLKVDFSTIQGYFHILKEFSFLGPPFDPFQGTKGGSLHFSDLFSTRIYVDIILFFIDDANMLTSTWPTDSR